MIYIEAAFFRQNGENVFQTKRRKCIKFLQFLPLVGNCDGTEKLSVVMRKKYVYNRNVKNNCESKTGGKQQCITDQEIMKRLLIP